MLQKRCRRKFWVSNKKERDGTIAGKDASFGFLESSIRDSWLICQPSFYSRDQFKGLFFNWGQNTTGLKHFPRTVCCLLLNHWVKPYGYYCNEFSRKTSHVTTPQKSCYVFSSIGYTGVYIKNMIQYCTRVSLFQKIGFSGHSQGSEWNKRNVDFILGVKGEHLRYNRWGKVIESWINTATR